MYYSASPELHKRLLEKVSFFFFFADFQVEHWVFVQFWIAGFEILAFPCNQFGGQEPGTNSDIKQFACTRFKAEFPIFDKVYWFHSPPLLSFLACSVVNDLLIKYLTCGRLMLMGRVQLQFISFWNQVQGDFWVIWWNGTLRSSWWTRAAKLSRDTHQQLPLSRLRYGPSPFTRFKKWKILHSWWWKMYSMIRLCLKLDCSSRWLDKCFMSLGSPWSDHLVFGCIPNCKPSECFDIVLLALLNLDSEDW